VILVFAALVGATLIVVRSTLFKRVRRVWPALLGCSQCVGFWTGALATFVPELDLPHGRAPFAMVVDALVVGCATSLSALATDCLLCKLAGEPDEEKTS
jgi:hypothetical protein